MKAARWQTVMSLVWEGAIAILTANAGLGEQGMTIGLAYLPVSPKKVSLDCLQS